MSSFIQIIVPQPLDQDQTQLWFRTVKSCLPSGMVGVTAIASGDQTRDSFYYHRVTANGKHAYVIPLVRDVEISEAHDLVRAWCTAYPQGDFLMDYSQSPDVPEPGPQRLEQGKLTQVLDAWARSQHQRWMDHTLAQGWRYGVKMSTREKTHPWLQPWENLPPAAQARNLEAVSDLLKLLDGFGYSICQNPQG
jgi:hypothetical protein